MLSKYIGDRSFLKRVLGFAIPIVIQNTITNFVSLLDNIMVGQVGTIQMSGVSIANQLILIFYLCIFGATAGAGIFGAQFHGSGDQEGVRHTTRYKVILCLILTALVIGLLIPFGPNLIKLYLQGEGDPADAAQTLSYGYEYMLVMLWGFIPFAMTNVYASTLRECGESTVPMFSGIVAVLVNLFFNYVLIFGHFGAPAMGVTGAAIATVISRYVEFFVVCLWTHTHTARYSFARGLFRSLYVPAPLTKRIFIKGMPLLCNEFLWSSGIAVLTQCYSICGLNVVPALNISGTINDFANVTAIAIANTVGIMMGQMMGAGKPNEEIRDCNKKLLTLSIIFGIIFGLFLACISHLFPRLYNTTDEVRTLAARLILILAVLKPLQSYLLCVYFTLRSGGKTWLTFFYDCGILWAFNIPLAYCLSRFAGLPILTLYLLCQSVDVGKAVLGFFLVRNGSWIQNLSYKKT